ncbi:hypothetical protein PENTCL1PPCAC_13073, partial [Pristionchus entomophagus]
SMTMVVRSTFLLAALSLVVVSGRFGPRVCSNITIQAEGNCPAKGYDCDDTLPIRYRVRDEDNWANAEVECVDEQACLAVDYQIVDKVRCRDSKWRAEGKCDIPTTSVVCAKRCDSDVCASHLHDAPSEYKKLSVHDATESSKCAVAKCKYGFVVLRRNGTPIKELPSSTRLSCSGNGKWAVNDKEKHTYVMCKRRGGGQSCSSQCDDRPWSIDDW